MQEIKILVVDATFLTRAPNREKTCRHITYWARSNGARVHILTTQMGIQFYKIALPGEIQEQISFSVLKGSRDYEKIELLQIVPEYLRRIAGAVLAILPRDIDVIYSISSVIVDPSVSLILKLRRRKAKVFVTFDNFVPAPSERPGKYIHKLIPYVASKMTLYFLRYVDCVFAYLTPNNVTMLHKRLRKRENNCIVRFTNGLDLSEISEAGVGIAKNYDLIFVGRLHPAKGIWDFLEVVLALKKKNKNIKTVVVGPAAPGVQASVDEFMREHSLNENIEVAGYVSTRKKYELLKSSKIFLFLSHDESFPVAVLEAIACGLPIFAYDLDVFASPPYNRACIKTAQKGDILAVVSWIIQALDNYDDLAREAERVSKEDALIPSYEHNADMEFKLFMEHR